MPATPRLRLGSIPGITGSGPRFRGVGLANSYAPSMDLSGLLVRRGGDIADPCGMRLAVGKLFGAPNREWPLGDCGFGTDRISPVPVWRRRSAQRGFRHLVVAWLAHRLADRLPLVPCHAFQDHGRRGSIARRVRSREPRISPSGAVRPPPALEASSVAIKVYPLTIYAPF
jgi:hypothetical protein